MSRTKTRTNLLDLVDSDSDDGLATIGVSQTTVPVQSRSKPVSKDPKDAMPAAKKTRARTTATASKVTKPAAKSKSTATATKKTTTTTTTAAARRASGRLAAALEKEVEDRDALIEKSANAVAVPTVKSKGGRGRKGKQAQDDNEATPDDLATAPESNTPVKPTRSRGRPKKTDSSREKEIPDSTRRAPAPAPTAAKRKGGRKVTVSAPEPEPVVEDETEIPETQQPFLDPMELDDPLVDDSDMADEGQQIENVPDTVRRGPWDLQPPPSARRGGAVPASALQTRTGGSVLDGGEPALRRRLGEMNKKYESLELRYRDLREVAIRDAERNFDKLKKNSEEKANTANQLITSLKSELATQREIAREAERMRRQLEERDAQCDELQAKVTALTTQLETAKSESKSLAVKLTASRNNAEAAAAVAIPGSAMKRSLMLPAGAAAAAQQAAQQAALVAQMKEDLYGDLTGLIVRGVKKEGVAEHVYDCIQTGRNGTLHFKLSVGINPSSDNYDEAQFVYMPQLDPSRDRGLIDVLPDYLAEEITFPRPHANKFYARVMKALTERQE